MHTALAQSALRPLAALAISAAMLPCQDVVYPEIAGEWWRVAGNPDLGELTGERQQPVDFAVWQAADGTWQLWSCIRRTKCGGHTRLFHRWEGKRLTNRDWTPIGIAMHADPDRGEPPGGLQAPHVVKHGGRYWMAYGNWNEICFATSQDGKTFERCMRPDGRTGAFGEGAGANTRDPMLIRIGALWHCYYTANPRRRGAVYCRTSPDLLAWSPSAVVLYGGSIGNGPWNSECPHVVEVEPGCFLLFRNQFYGAKERNWVYQSANPFNFGIDEDVHMVASLPVAAPEIIQHDGKSYLAALATTLDGIRIARLRWVRVRPGGKPVFDLDQESGRAGWRVVEGELASVFTTSARQQFQPPLRHFIGTGETVTGLDDAQVAVIESPAFTIDEDLYYVSVSGGRSRDATYVAVIVASGEEAEQEIARFSGRNSNTLEYQPLRVAGHRGKKVRIRVVDRAQSGWGHINFGGLFAPNVVSVK